MEMGGGVFIFFIFLLLFVPSGALSAPCANGGTAVGDTCVCPPGHSGRLCETPDPSSSCHNGGTAVGTSCYCPPGFGGPRCQRRDPASACHNGATAFGTRCVCPPGFRGDTCREPEELGPCLNGGTREEKGTCRCPPAAWGPRCECTRTGATTAAGRALYVGDSAGTIGADAGGTMGGVASVRRDRNVTAGPVEGNATAAVIGHGGVVERNGTVTGAVGATTVSHGVVTTVSHGVVTTVSHGVASTDHGVVTITEEDTAVNGGTDHDVLTMPVTVSHGVASTDPGVVTITERDRVVNGGTDHDVVTMPVTVSHGVASTDHGVVTITEEDTAVNGGTDHDVVTTRVVSPTTVTHGVASTDHGVVTIPERDRVVNGGTDHDVVTMPVTVSHGVASTDPGVVTITERDRVVNGGTDHDVVTTRVVSPTTVSHGVASTDPGVVTIPERDRVVNGGTDHDVVTTRVVSPTTVSHGVASRDHGVVTIPEEDTAVNGGMDHDVVTTLRATRIRGSVPMATTPMLPVRNITASPVRSHARATTMEGETTAMDGDTTAMEGDTEATPIEGDTEATPVATTVESGTMVVPPGHLGSHSRATTTARNTTRATTLEGDTSVTTVESHRRTMENNTRATITESDTTATTLESDTTAMPTIITGGHNRTVENNTRATTPKSDTRATTLENHTLSTLPVTSTPAPPNATSTVLNVTKSPSNVTKATGELSHVSAGTTGDFLTSSTVPTTVATMATICLYLPHGASPPAIACRNGGVANRTHCLCPPGFSGAACETPDAADRCAGGSTAVGDRCVCPPGRAGPRCASPDPATACRHGGTAVGTRCFCPPGFSGDRCENPRPTTVRTPHRTREVTRRTRRTTTTTTTVATTRDPCLNGGLWMGTACLCPPNMDGPRCEFGATTINLTAELGPFVTMMARVTNREFSEDMRDASSPGHRRFAEEFGRTMDGIYRNVPGYRGIKVLSLSRGSVVVNYRVQLRPLPTNTNLEHQALELLAMTNAASRPHNCSTAADGLCFTATSARATRATRPALNDTELCRTHAPANFSRFYFPYRTANGLLCVTNCTLNVPGAFDCHHGLCRLTRDGPQCFCPDLPWYLSAGERCQTHISKLGLGLGVGLGLGLTILILLILCIVLTVRLARGTRKSPGARVTTEDNWPDGGRNSRVTGIYHVNGRGTGKGPYGYNTYKPSSEVAEPPAPVVAEGAAAL